MSDAAQRFSRIGKLFTCAQRGEFGAAVDAQREPCRLLRAVRHHGSGRGGLRRLVGTEGVRLFLVGDSVKLRDRSRVRRVDSPRFAAEHLAAEQHIRDGVIRCLHERQTDDVVHGPRAAVMLERNADYLDVT
ncbi:hypothetical protein [Burkholderia ubonensis]|uniref:hypothetical protein n=1 Tax=Burkholderia ubonensis TaxID=101571 RepID=UPI0012FC52BD|nr:hypothetical protein [Burkholderia ubonensis]